MLELEIKISGLAELSAVAEKFLAARPSGAVVGLWGDLGVGKTEFVRQFISKIAAADGLAAPKVTSPTFVIHQRYSLRRPIDHFDLYRLSRIDDGGLSELGYYDVLAERAHERGFVFVEWPDRASELKLLELTDRFTLDFESATERHFRWEAA